MLVIILDLETKREGDVEFLIKNEKKYNYQVIKPKPLLINKKIVSSSLIRNYLEKGLLKKVLIDY